MANYAYTGSTYRPYDLSAYDPSQYSLFTRQAFNFDPQTGFEDYLRTIRPSLSLDRTLRNLYGTYFADYQRQAIRDYNPAVPDRTFLDYLKDFDIEREMARLTPRERGQDPSRFTRPVRWVTF